MKTLITQPSQELRGELRMPGDKSISHRAIFLASLAEGMSRIRGFLPGEDCLATLNAMRQLGVSIQHQDTDLEISGVGLRGLQSPTKALDLGNSGTSMRLLSGILAGQSFESTLTGDASLVNRPMQRVIIPLELMGARIQSDDGYPPLKIQGCSSLQGIDYSLPVASAQVKSAILLAGLYANSMVTVTEPQQTRDHTERLFKSFGVDTHRVGNRVSVVPNQILLASDLEIPGDFSSAAFFIVAATIAEKGELWIRDLGLNPTRIGLLDLLRMMGAQIEVGPLRQLGHEPIADLCIRPARLQGIDVPLESVANAIDEFPIFMIAAALAKGVTRIGGASELRVKESDRISSMITGLKSLGIRADALPDGAIIEGGICGEGCIDSQGDHRVAMAFAIMGSRAKGSIMIREADNIATSFPNFLACANSCGLLIEGVNHV